ncbi:MAG TPA: glycolate oxidase subunit GlcF [Casimicrobiaceae bacterium]|nr:glycolate oxidase subunit GlcF [Casimicrobiaceae bacterium]
METRLAPQYAGTPEGQEAETIVRTCVHCGFCLATCPTYLLLGGELDSPRGRIYLMKQVLEGAAPTAKTQLHLDRCLTCRNCETTCPSGVRYGRLVDIGRRIVDERVARSPLADAKRAALRRGLLSKPLFGAALSLGRHLKAWLPASLAASVPDARPAGPWPAPRHARRMLIMKGCVQPALAPDTDAATARVLDRAGISAIGVDGGGCCGAVSYHLSAHDEARAIARRNVDAWWPEIERGVEAIVVTASGCGVMLHEYGHLFAGDSAYAEKGRRIVELARDPAEVVRDAWSSLHPRRVDRLPVAFHSPCTLQHGLQIRGVVEQLLGDCGYRLTPVADVHLCCGSAGTYSLLQPVLARTLKENKLRALEAGQPQVIATANIGCLSHLQSGTPLPVRHWIELVDQALG